MTQGSSGSEVKQLLAQIEAEYDAACLGLSGLNEGTARHAFITARMERIQQASEQLITTLGYDRAMPLIVDTLKHKPS